MPNLELSEDYYVAWNRKGIFTSGQVFHLQRFHGGGKTATHIARFFLSESGSDSEAEPVTRLDCFVNDDKRAPSPDWLGRRLTEVLLGSGHLAEPYWTSWHSSEEISGTGEGGGFDFG